MWDSRVEHGAVVVDEAGADELVSGLRGPQAELHYPLISCRQSRDQDQSELRRRDTPTPQHRWQCVRPTVERAVRWQLPQRGRHAGHLTSGRHLARSLRQVLEDAGHTP